MAEKGCVLFALRGDPKMTMPKSVLIKAMDKVNDALYLSGIYDEKTHQRIEYGIATEDESEYRELMKYLLLICSNMSFYEKHT